MRSERTRWLKRIRELKAQRDKQKHIIDQLRKEIELLTKLEKEHAWDNVW